MQTLTLFFGFAIVAIAMENFTAKFRFEKTSVAGAKDNQGIQSRNDRTFKYTLRGITGEEKVIVTDGDDVQEYTLNKTDTILHTTSDEITISYINDKCCNPDRNVMFNTGEPKIISTANNTFPQNYQSNWNCSQCPYKIMQNATQRMKLLSRQERYDRCRAVALTDDGKLTTEDDCDNCEILDDGQFCQPGNYTVQFRNKNQCKGVTFGGCNVPEEIVLKPYDPKEIKNAKLCQLACAGTDFCEFYTFNEQTEVCRLLRKDYRASCKIMAGPVDKKPTYCLEVEKGQLCDAEIEEQCEYTGKKVIDIPEGGSGQPGDCQKTCEDFAPECKYWIHDKTTNSCILKRDGSKTCAIWAGPKEPSYQFCRDQDRLN